MVVAAARCGWPDVAKALAAARVRFGFVRAVLASTFHDEKGVSTVRRGANELSDCGVLVVVRSLRHSMVQTPLVVVVYKSVVGLQ